MLPKRAEAGVVIGGYELVRRIGRGGMAEVWVARKALGKKGSKFVAIKLMADHYVGEERYARMFRAEAELAAVLSHANIVQVFDEGEDEGRSYLIMEWVDGLNLLKLGDMLALLDDEQRRFRVISYIIGQLLHALNYAHSITSHDGSPLGVVHRDVSPQNVLVSNHGEVKLTDFGVAYQVMEESSGIHVKGKVRYMSPEQLSGKTRLPTVDLYAVGALLHELLDGRRFRGEFEDGQDLFSVVLSGQVSQMSRRIPPELDRLRLGLLEPDAGRRIQTAEQAIAVLKRYPDYGDARDELTKLCGSLTGVVRPRVGPGQSDQVAAADHATTRWGGRNPLAKPKVDAGPGRPPPPRSPVRPVSAPPRTGSTTAVKNAAEAIAESRALITGQTEFVKPQALPELTAGAASPPVVSSSAPTTPLRVNKLRAMVAEPAVRSSPGIAAPVPVQPALASAAPMHVPVQPSRPLDVQMEGQANAAPVYVPGQASHPIHVQAAPHWTEASNPSTRPPPTERLSSEASGAASHPGGTEVFDSNMIMEVASGSGTEQDILPVAVGREGTDTRREVPGGVPARSNSVSIVLPQRSAVAVIGLGLVLVAVMSVSITWFLFTRGRDGATESLAASVVEPKAEAAEPEAAEPEAAEPEGKQEPAVVSAGGEVPEPEEEAAQDSDAQGAPGEGSADPTPTADAVPDATAEGAGTDDEEVKDADAKPSVVAPPPATAKKPVKPQPKAVVKVVSSSGLENAQVRLGSQTYPVDGTRKHDITAGRKTIKWRATASDPWQSGKAWTFKPGEEFVIRVNKKGPTVITSK